MAEPHQPAWQTEELQDEWIDVVPDDAEYGDNDNNNLSYGTRSVSFTAPLSSQIQTISDRESDVYSSVGERSIRGTFLVRDDAPGVPLFPKTPGRHKKGLIKDIFTPLHLERMFEPPSPPTPPEQRSRSVFASSSKSEHAVRRADEIVETDIPDMASFHGRKANLSCRFTFAMPKEQGSLNPDSEAFPQAQSTPNPPLPSFPSSGVAASDPRLRLFQFQYDTYTRDHLSAMVDSIAINTPSGTGTGATPSPTNITRGLSRVSEVNTTRSSASHLRSAKRVKLSPAADFYGEDAGAGASIARPKLIGKDYVGESRSLMQQIKQARDFSTISTVASSQHHSPRLGDGMGVEPTNRPSFLSVRTTSNEPSPMSATFKSGTSSSSTYREQAAALMAQIRNDMRGQKRLFSGETDVSHAGTHPGGRLSRSSTPEVEKPRSNLHIEEQESKCYNSLGHRRTSSLRSDGSRHRPSPGKSGRRVVSAAQVEDQLSDWMSGMSMHQRRPSQSSTAVRDPSPFQRDPTSSLPPPLSSLAPPAYPSSSLRARTNEDLNRFVSSSTASGTTLTAGSAPSFVKHAGPAQIRTIAPTDVPQLPDRLGDMLFDKVMMRWVKSTAHSVQIDGEANTFAEEMSEDPFGDIESLRDDSNHRDGRSLSEVISDRAGAVREMSRIEEQSEVDDEEEMELNSFSTDDPSALAVDVMTGVESNMVDNIDDDDETTDSDVDDRHDQALAPVDIQEIESDSEEEEIAFDGAPSSPTAQPSAPLLTVGTPNRPTSLSVASPALRPAIRSHTATPVSVLKDPNRQRLQTPSSDPRYRRSVSFSDGKRDGPIQGLVAGSGSPGTSAVVQSARSRRIEQMMHALEESDGSPSKSTGAARPEELQALSERQSNTSGASASPRRVFSRSRTHRLSGGGDGSRQSNATFLTECSFAVAHDRLVEVITDVQPFLPYWEELNSIDLSNKRLESVARIKEFLPHLDSLNLNNNQLAWLSGIPGTLRTLSVASNFLTGLTSYNHLLNLENLDISRNEIESLRQLACLRHLRELKVDGNKLTTLDGLQHMDGLIKLSVQDNSLHSIDLNEYQWSRLELLNFSNNRLIRIQGVASLQALIAMNLDNNEVEELEFSSAMPRLRILRTSGNRLHQLDVACVPNLRTLYADNNSLAGLVKVDRLTKLENLSLRNQSGRGLNLLTRDVRDVKRLYLSGNRLKTGFLQEPCYNLLYLELAACRLTVLPEDMSRLVPNLRVLNLNYNFLEDARPLEGLTRLKKLTIIGSRLKATKPLIRLLQRMPDVEMLDFRMNPCTLGWYLPLLVKDVPGALQPSEGGKRGGRGRSGQAWQELDIKFRRDLPDESYIGRLAYRGLIMRACGRLRLLDGVEVTEKEKRKASQLLVGLLGGSAAGTI